MHVSGNQYVIFSSFQMGFYIDVGSEYEGFKYVYGENLYVGAFKEKIKSDGIGKILIMDKAKDQAVWHVFDG